jgi:hypothetical protein
MLTVSVNHYTRSLPAVPAKAIIRLCDAAHRVGLDGSLPPAQRQLSPVPTANSGGAAVLRSRSPETSNASSAAPR